MKSPEKGDIFWISLDPELAGNIEKARPYLILSNSISNQFSDQIMVCPISRNLRNIFPFEAPVSVRGRKCKAMLDQVRPISKLRLNMFISSISGKEMILVEKALKIVFDLE